MNKTIVSISGYGATGSSAVTDFLKGFDSVDVLDDFEFQLLYFPDGISDLDYKLNGSCSRFYDSDVAITRFLDLCTKLEDWYEPAFHGSLRTMAEDYIADLMPVRWQGYWAFDRLNTSKEYVEGCHEENERKLAINKRRSFANKFLRRLHLPQLEYLECKRYKDFFNYRPMYMSIMPEDFIHKTQAFTWNLISTASHQDRPVVAVDMLLPPQNPDRFQKYFPCPVKSIVVNRDPRDLFSREYTAKWPVVPHEDAGTFIAWYKENMKAEANVDSPDILRIHFEDMVYDYENTSRQICEFLGLDELPTRQLFDPHLSVANTRLYQKLEVRKADIEMIEQELSEYLYDFDSREPVECLSEKVF